jgi:hypothetical protein
VVICSRYGATDTVPSDTSIGLNFNCTITQCTGSQLREECNGTYNVDSCSAAINYVITETFGTNRVDGVITSHTTYSGANCHGLQNSCDITGIHLTKLNSDTTNCGLVSSGGGGTLSMSCKVNGTPWTGTYALANIHGTGATNILNIFAERSSDSSSIDLALNTSASVSAKTYSQADGLTLEYLQGTDVFLGDATTQMTISSINGTSKTIAGTFQGNAVPFLSGGSASITEGTFSGSFTTTGSPAIGSPRWILHQMIRPKR